MNWDLKPDDTDELTLTPEERKAIYKASAVMGAILLIAGLIILYMMK